MSYKSKHKAKYSEVRRLALEGLRSNQIGERLEIPTATVRTICHKLGIGLKAGRGRPIVANPVRKRPRVGPTGQAFYDAKDKPQQDPFGRARA